LHEQRDGGGGVGDVEALPGFAAGMGVARWARREVGGHDLVATGDERPDEVVADLAAGPGEEDLHEARIIDRASSAGKPGIDDGCMSAGKPGSTIGACRPASRDRRWEMPCARRDPRRNSLV